MHHAIRSHNYNEASGQIEVTIDCDRLLNQVISGVHNIKLTPIEMTASEIFERVKKHLLEQRVPAKTENGACQYRTNNGKSCAIGILLLETNNYNPALENLTANDLHEVGLFPCLNNSDLISKLQEIHDNQNPRSWNLCLDALKTEYKRDLS